MRTCKSFSNAFPPSICKSNPNGYFISWCIWTKIASCVSMVLVCKDMLDNQRPIDRFHFMTVYRAVISYFRNIFCHHNLTMAPFIRSNEKRNRCFVHLLFLSTSICTVLSPRFEFRYPCPGQFILSQTTVPSPEQVA